MANKYYQKHKERLRKEAPERYQNLSGEGKTKYEKEMLKKKKGITIIRNMNRSYLHIEEIII